MATDVKAIVDGNIWKVLVEKGAAVSTGDVVVIMESMKLEIPVEAPAAGEVVELNGDCFGDAVNVAARLIDHAGDGEILITAEVLTGLHHASKGRFRSLDRISVRGRIEPVHVYRMDAAPLLGADAAATQFGEPMRATEPDGMRLVWGDLDRVFDILSMPVVLGRSVQATYCITDARVSRSHARIDWQGSSFELTDLSYNGTYVRFGDSGELLSLKRGSCTLHGSGSIGLGGPPICHISLPLRISRAAKRLWPRDQFGFFTPWMNRG